MFKNQKKNNGNEEVILEVNAEAELMLTEAEERALLDMIDEGYTPTDEEIAALNEVNSIGLSRINRIPKSINLLANLQWLILDGAQITDLSGIQNLTNLRWLVLSDTSIHDLSGIEKLANLQSLDLANLQSLDLDNAYSIDLSGIEKLTNLQSLYLRGAKITDLSGIEDLTKLQELDLSNTPIDSNELEKLAKLKNLTHLDLSYLKLAKIPHQILELGLPFDTISEYDASDRSGIYLYGTELTQQPLSLFEQDRKLIEEYYKSEMVKVGEAKVIFLGHGRVGKTHTIERIKNNGESIEPINGETPGIQITSIKDFGDEWLNVQFWDFGGQDIMHTMHRCFLTERCCYVIVVNTRQGDVNKQARYWLNNIKSFAPNAPVILFENRWGKGDIGGGLDENRLKKEFPNIRSSRSFSALEAEKALFNSSLVKDIRIVCSELDSVKMEFPKNWAKIRKKLLELKGSKEPFIDKEKYYTLCRDCGENSPDIAKWLLSWFNDLGVCLSYHQNKETCEELDNYQLLEPNWFFNAIYTIINKFKDASRNGIIPIEIIKYRLRPHSPYLADSLMPDADYEGKIDYILKVMREYRLLHEISDTEVFIPALCESNTPEDLHPNTWKKHVTYKYVYQFLPDNVVHQMMLFWKQEMLHEPTKLWLKGFRIDFKTEGTAFVIDTGNDDNILLIDVYSLDGSSPCKQFIKIQENINEINKRLGLSPYECTSVEKNGIKQDLPVSPLRKMWTKGIQTYTILDQENYAQIKLRDVLAGIFGITPDESKKADRLDDSIGEEYDKRMMTEALFDKARSEYINLIKDKASRNAGDGASNVNIEIENVHFHDKSSLLDSSSNVNNGYTDEHVTELLKHQERITEKMLDTIAKIVEEQSKQQPSLNPDEIKAIVAELKKKSPKTPGERLQTWYDNFVKFIPMLKLIVDVILATTVHTPGIVNGVQTVI